METRPNIPYVVFMILFSLSIINLIHLGTEGHFKEIGHDTINLTFTRIVGIFLYFIIIKRNYEDLKNLWVVFAFFCLFAIIYVVSYYLNMETANKDYLIRLLFAFLSIFTMMLIKWDKKVTIIFGYLLTIVLFLLFIDWIHHDFPLSRFKGSHYANINGLGVTLFCFSYFLILAIKYSKGTHRILFSVSLALNFFLLFTTSSRTPMLALVLILVGALFIKIFKSYRIWFLITVFSSAALVPFYIWFQNTKLASVINEWSLAVFNKSLYSGREKIWGTLLEVALESPIIGYGIGIDGRQFGRHTAHNQYIQTLLEVGLIGLIVLLILLYFIYDMLVKNKTAFAARLSALYFCGILIYEVFELTLFQNNYSISILQWLIITAGIFFIEDKSPGETIEH